MRLLLSALLLLLPAVGWGQLINRVRVVDAVTGLPITASQSVEMAHRGIGGGYSRGIYHFSAPGYAPLAVAAAQLEGTVHPTIRMQPLDQVLPEAVIAVDRMFAEGVTVPQPVREIGQRELVSGAPATTADALAQTGEVFVQQSQLGGGSPVLRGFEANKVLLTVDGIRLNNLIYRGGHLQNVLTLDNAALDRAEVVMGTGSPAYGSDALGGVVALFTRSPHLITGSDTARLGGTAFTRYATANRGQTAHLTLDYGRRKVGVLSSVTLARFGDLRVGRNGRRADWGDWGLRPTYQTRQGEADVAAANSNPLVQRGSGYNQADALLKIVFAPTDAWYNTFNLQGSTSTEVPRTDRLSETRDGQPRFAEWTYGPQRRGLAAWQVQHFPDSDVAKRLYDRLNLSVAAQHLEESRHDRRWQAPARNNRFERVRSASVNADFKRDLPSRVPYDNPHQFLRYGVELLYQTVRSTAFTTDLASGARRPLDTRYPDGGSSVRNAAVYATYEARREALTVTAGGRFTANELRATFTDATFFPFPFRDVQQRQTALTGHAGLTRRFLHGWWLAARGASGFRAPNVDDLAKVFESVPGALVVPNPKLRPERTWSAELTVRRQAAAWLDARLTGYHTWYRNALGLSPGQLNGADSALYDGVLSQVLIATNRDRARLWGATAAVVVTPAPGLSVRSTLTFTRGRFQTDSGAYPLDHIPPLFGRTGVRYQRSRFEAETYAFYHGAKRLADYNLVGEDNIQYALPSGTPAWYTLNARVGWQARPFLWVQAALENALDRHYRPFASGISAPGRNLILTARASW